MEGARLLDAGVGVGRCPDAGVGVAFRARGSRISESVGTPSICRFAGGAAGKIGAGEGQAEGLRTGVETKMVGAAGTRRDVAEEDDDVAEERADDSEIKSLFDFLTGRGRGLGAGALMAVRGWALFLEGGAALRGAALPTGAGTGAIPEGV